MRGSEGGNGPVPVGGVTILVLGILGIAFCGILSPLAWIRGSRALRLIDEGTGDEAERGLALAGWVCGIIGTFLLGLTLFLLYVRTTNTIGHIR